MAKTEGGSSARRALRVLKALKGKSLQGVAVKDLAEGLGEKDVDICRSLTALYAEGLAHKLDDGRWAQTTAMLGIAEAYYREMSVARSRLDEHIQRVQAASAQ